MIWTQRKLPTDHSSDKQRENPDRKACKRPKSGCDSSRALNPQPSKDHVRQRAQSARSEKPLQTHQVHRRFPACAQAPHTPRRTPVCPQSTVLHSCYIERETSYRLPFAFGCIFYGLFTYTLSLTCQKNFMDFLPSGPIKTITEQLTEIFRKNSSFGQSG